MENIIVLVDFLGATCDYFFKTSQSNLPISMDTYLNVKPKLKNHAKEIIEPLNCISVSSYLEEFKEKNENL